MRAESAHTRQDRPPPRLRRLRASAAAPPPPLRRAAPRGQVRRRLLRAGSSPEGVVFLFIEYKRYAWVIACASWMSPHAEDEKVWVTFEWTESPNMSWKPDDKRVIDHRLIVKLNSQRQGVLKQWKDVTRVIFVKDLYNYYKMELYDTQNQQFQSVYLRCKTFADNDEVKFTGKNIVESQFEWSTCIHWDLTDNKNGTYTACMQHLPSAKFNASLKNANPYICSKSTC
jgi:hypothetical protein